MTTPPLPPEISMPKLYIIRGIPGSGKSTLAKALNISLHFEADMWFERFNNGKFDASQLKAAHAWCFDQVKFWLESGKDVVVSNTFTRKWEFEPYTKLNAQIFVLIANGNYKNIHGVPDSKVKEMKQRFEY